jgi:hypothetical protein
VRKRTERKENKGYKKRSARGKGRNTATKKEKLIRETAFKKLMNKINKDERGDTEIGTREGNKQANTE